MNVPSPFVSAIIVAAGSSTRMGGGLSKQLLTIGEMPVIYHTIKAFQECTAIDEIIISARECDFEPISAIASEYHFDKVSKLVSGGETRQQSVKNGIAAVSGKCLYLAVHDGARPLVTCSDITLCINAAIEHGAAALGTPIVDTLKLADTSGKILGTQSRNSLWAVHTPQIFEKELYLRALKAAEQANAFYTDDCQLIEAVKANIFIVNSSRFNIKITTPEDLLFAEAALKLKNSI
ncbi:MAG: 2-C-methyl-D-erythritol 4-phosphate cytidylyltransferase [Oscillospiraceae bacterium]|nr:2-C-methyl-D-erythritol 4-phosphate cytidylyltransferase [Oscillospiraceae bacterium]